ncbi:MAG: hypothetical protein M2R45_03947 [Verrucomicrobia subdivision 3 bacterium]|nr:hypothetical protein [Limisphaerales bacterium]MCS1415533.1 hypothetical protein [Limisphaerales bacterium]
MRSKGVRRIGGGPRCSLPSLEVVPLGGGGGEVAMVGNPHAFPTSRRWKIFIGEKSELSPQGDFHFRPRVANIPAVIGPCVLVIVSLKTTPNDQFSRLIPPLVNSETAILYLQDGLGNIGVLACLFPGFQFLGELCFICVNRLALGVIAHLNHGQIVIGEIRGWPKLGTHETHHGFRSCGIRWKVTDQLRSGSEGEASLE